MFNKFFTNSYLWIIRFFHCLCVRITGLNVGIARGNDSYAGSINKFLQLFLPSLQLRGVCSVLVLR